MRLTRLLLLLAGAGCGSSPPRVSPTVATGTPGTPPTRPTATAAAEEDDDGCPPGQVLIPGTVVWMGVPRGKGREEEQAAFQKELPSFCLDAREVTVEQYQACTAAKVCDPLPADVEGLRDAKSAEAESALCTARLPNNARLPANCVDHEDATRYCGWKGQRLPSEAEFEMVAIGGADKLTYPWGEAAPDDGRLCWKQKQPCEVGSRPAAAYGLFDVAGGVSEWTGTPYGPYPDPPASGTRYSVRGASWKTTDSDDVRGKRRFHREATERSTDVGFRCAKSR